MNSPNPGSEDADFVQFARLEPKRLLRAARYDQEYELTDYTYGVLVPDREHPLSNVSVANSALSIDPWVGCAWQCAYCHVQGSLEDLAENSAMPKSTRRRTKHAFGEILDALIRHPFFVPNDTVLSIGTASTEPLAPGQVVESTFYMMEYLQQLGLRNPFWIVTKRGMPAKYLDRLERICSNGSSVMLSLCWAGNPVELEPVQNYRFLNAEGAHAAGATLAWYLRPLAPAWGATPDKLRSMIRTVGESHGQFLSAVVPGGLRWTEGVDRAVRDVRGMTGVNVDQQVISGNEKQELPLELAQSILKHCREYLPETPVYFKSSCALSHMLKRPSISAVDVLSRDECELSLCPTKQRQICASGPIHTLTEDGAQLTAHRLGLPLQIISWDDRTSLPRTDPPLNLESYAISQVFENSLNTRIPETRSDDN